MKKLLFLTLFISSFAFGQGVRVGDALALQTTAVLQGVTVLVPVGTSSIQFCSAPANATPCSNKATTYTDRTLGTPCSTSTQVVLAGTSSCVAQSDSLGNWGVWVASGNYEWTYTDSGGNSHGPYPVTANSAPNTNAWSALTAPSSNLSLAMGANTSSLTYSGSVASGTSAFSILPTSTKGLSLLGGGEVLLGTTGNSAITNPTPLALSFSLDVANPTSNALACGTTALAACTTGQTAGSVVGICVEHCTTLATGQIAVFGVVPCAFDGATTLGHWVIVSTTVASDCRDSGSATPPATSVSTIGRVLSTNASAGTYPVLLQISR